MLAWCRVPMPSRRWIHDTNWKPQQRWFPQIPADFSETFLFNLKPELHRLRKWPTTPTSVTPNNFGKHPNTKDKNRAKMMRPASLARAMISMVSIESFWFEKCFCPFTSEFVSDSNSSGPKHSVDMLGPWLFQNFFIQSYNVHLGKICWTNPRIVNERICAKYSEDTCFLNILVSRLDPPNYEPFLVNMDFFFFLFFWNVNDSVLFDSGSPKYWTKFPLFELSLFLQAS